MSLFYEGESKAMASSLKHLDLGNICPILSSLSHPTRNRLPRSKNSMDLRGCYRGRLMLPLEWTKHSSPFWSWCSTTRSLSIPKFKLPFTLYNIVGKALNQGSCSGSAMLLFDSGLLSLSCLQFPFSAKWFLESVPALTLWQVFT